jgi:hypothetical protein
MVAQNFQNIDVECHLGRPVRCLKITTLMVLALLITACGGDSNSPENPIPPTEPAPNAVTQAPINQISHAFLLDTDGAPGKLAGTVIVEATSISDTDTARTESIWIYWADELGNTFPDTWKKTVESAVYQIEIPEGTIIPQGAVALLLVPSNAVGQATQVSLVPFQDFTGNALLSGPGGNEQHAWYYGEDRPKISIQRKDGLCTFDNGLVSVTDMNNTRDLAREQQSDFSLPNEVNESAFPSYEFYCDDNPVNTFREISDEIGVWTFSTLNDAMFYGTIVNDSFVKYLGEPPLRDKIRLRVHYGPQYLIFANWDGAYANFSDGYPFQYSTASLDVIAHEIGHGVLNRISSVNSFEGEISTDARTLHEAFGDLSGVMAKYDFTGHTDNWIHGKESVGYTRKLNQIRTQAGAIDSLLDYDDAGNNFYKRIGMITYPFYLLSNQWGIEPTYRVYLSSARECWTAMTTLTEAAQCIKQQAGILGLPESDVVEAFKTVKIQLFNEGVLSHFFVEESKLQTKFIDNSRSTNQVSEWLWNFGDGQTSIEASPEHTYTEAGDYQVSLMVTDQSNHQDSFERLISVAN